MTGYREEKGGTFEANGTKYDLNYIFAHVEKETIQEIAVDKLKWVLDHGPALNKDRVAQADLSVPVLVTKLDGQELVVDGAHRLTKAVEAGQKTIPYRRVSSAVLHASEVKPVWHYW